MLFWPRWIILCRYTVDDVRSERSETFCAKDVVLTSQLRHGIDLHIIFSFHTILPSVAGTNQYSHKVMEMVAMVRLCRVPLSMQILIIVLFFWIADIEFSSSLSTSTWANIHLHLLLLRPYQLSIEEGLCADGQSVLALFTRSVYVQWLARF